MIDNYGRNINYMRISVTELCNLRCRYCMPEEGIAKRPHEEMMTFEEIVAAARAAASLGIKKIRITGGEPLVKRGIVGLCREISAIDGIDELCMTTFSAGFKKIKINTVLMGGFNDDEVADFVALTKERPVEIRFIELMPIGGGIGFDKARFISCEEVLKKVPELRSAGFSDGVAAIYRLPGAPGRVGLIRPISCEFCDRCNKIRLTADGMLKPCLHSGAEISLRGMDLDGMKQTIRAAVLGKPEMRNAIDADNPSEAGRNMNMIGG